MLISKTGPISRAAAAAVAALVLSVATAVAQERFTPQHVASLRTVTAAVISPEGGHIAYVLSVPRVPFDDEDGPAWEELHVVDSAGASRPFVSGQVNVGGVRWMPDGRGIGFLARRGGDTARTLYVSPLGGGEARRLLRHDTDIVQFDVSPDGRRLAFVARPSKPKDVQELERHGFNQEVFEESAQPQRLWVADLRDGEVAGAPRAVALPGHPSHAAWSPDGRRLLVIHAPTPLVDDDLMRRRVLIVDPESGRIDVRIENPGKLGPAAWSPDGQWVALVAGEDQHDPSEGRLMVVPASGGELRDLLPGYEAHVRHVAWTDPQTLLFAADEGVGSTIGEVRRDGSGRRTIVSSGDGPIVTGFHRAAKAGAVALVADTPQHPSEVYRLAADADEAVRLTDNNRWLRDVRLAPQEVVTFTARDGLELQGILIRPLDEQPGRRYPLILTVHGGPEARDPNGWRTSYSHAGQLAAAQGFAVFYPNYRGSTGRGVAFSKLGQGDPAGKEFDDLVDAVDHLVKIGLVDRAKVGITGGSYGGYASAWGATYYTDRFAAAVMFVGISNHISKVGTSDIPDELYLVHARKRVWEDWSFFLERSPIYHAGKSRTATLILHGADDPRVHPTQSLELYRHLKAHGHTPVRLVWYPREGHGNRRAASRLDYNLRLMQWMTHYLQGPGGEPPSYQLDYRRHELTGAGEEAGAVGGER
jgi:dipeptidyl aminopeptidase/acylaminoacyl peptidase